MVALYHCPHRAIEKEDVLLEKLVYRVRFAHWAIQPLCVLLTSSIGGKRLSSFSNYVKY
jgi:hypothetical protein